MFDAAALPTADNFTQEELPRSDAEVLLKEQTEDAERAGHLENVTPPIRKHDFRASRGNNLCDF